MKQEKSAGFLGLAIVSLLVLFLLFFSLLFFAFYFFFFWTEMGNGKVGFKNLAPRNKGIFSEFFLCFRNILALFVSNLEFMPP